MNSSRRVVLIVLLVAALSAVAVSPAAAAPAGQGTGPNLPALSCESGTCELTGSAGGLLGILRDAHLSLKQLPAQGMTESGSQATLDLQKDVTLSLPVGEITLTNARLQLELGADGKVRRLNGSADMPFPTFGLLDNVHVVAPARASVGLDLGKNLPDTGFEPVPDRPYLFFSANTFMNLTGRTAGQQDDFSLAFTPGQRLTLVVDTVEPVAYLNGHVTLSITDQIALLGGILESTPLGPYVPDTLPLRERTQYGLSGKFSKDLAKSQLTLRGAYLLDAGFLPAQLGVDARLVDVLGELTLTRNGALVDGVLKSSIQPDKVFDSRVEVKTFIPFDETAGPGYASVDAMAKAPAVRLGVGGGATASAGHYQLTGRLSTPFTRSDLKGQVVRKPAGRRWHGGSCGRKRRGRGGDRGGQGRRRGRIGREQGSRRGGDSRGQRRSVRRAAGIERRGSRSRLCPVGREPRA